MNNTPNNSIRGSTRQSPKTKENKAQTTQIIKHMYKKQRKLINFLLSKQKKVSTNPIDQSVLESTFFKKRYRSHVRSFDIPKNDYTRDNDMSKFLVGEEIKEPLFLSIYKQILGFCEIAKNDEINTVDIQKTVMYSDEVFEHSDLSFKVRDKMPKYCVSFEPLLNKLRKFMQAYNAEKNKIAKKTDKFQKISELSNFFKTEVKGGEAEAMEKENKDNNREGENNQISYLYNVLFNLLAILKSVDYKKFKTLEIVMNFLLNYLNLSFWQKIKIVKKNHVKECFDYQKEIHKLKTDIKKLRERYLKVESERSKLKADKRVYDKNREKMRNLFTDFNNYTITLKNQRTNLLNVWKSYRNLSDLIKEIEESRGWEKYVELDDFKEQIKRLKNTISESLRNCDNLKITSKIKEPEELLDFSLVKKRHDFLKFENKCLQTDKEVSYEIGTQFKAVMVDQEIQATVDVFERGNLCKNLDKEYNKSVKHVDKLKKMVINLDEKLKKQQIKMQEQINDFPQISVTRVTNPEPKKSINRKESIQVSDESMESKRSLKNSLPKFSVTKHSYNYHINFVLANLGIKYKRLCVSTNRMTNIAYFVFRLLLEEREERDPILFTYNYFSTKSIQNTFSRKYFLVFMNSIQTRQDNSDSVLSILKYIFQPTNLNTNSYMIELLRRMYDNISP